MGHSYFDRIGDGVLVPELSLPVFFLRNHHLNGIFLLYLENLIDSSIINTRL